MDFIDDFIQEYKNNPCLWKANCINFKNRSKRQEAYLKLIDVATKHGEHYNVERTKQKINNLRCAFRHQLKKYTEFKSRGEKEEPYCPKRRYFESLMFLKDEESPEKSKQEVVFIEQSSQNETIKTKIFTETDQQNLYTSESGLYDKDKMIEMSNVNKESVECKNMCDKVIKPANQVLDKNVRCSIMEKEGNISSHNNAVHESERTEHAPHYSHDSIELSSTFEKVIDSQIYDFDKDSENRIKKRNYRKRSLSTSSQQSTENDFISSKTLKGDASSIDVEKIFSLACKSIQSNLDDNFSNLGKIIAHKLRSMEPMQAIYAEKIITDVLFQGQMKLLSTLSINQFLNIESPNSFVEFNSSK